MFGRNQVSDRDLLKSINQRLARTGTGSSSKVNVSVQQGNVTLTGSLQHAYQRDPIVKAITRVTGVRRINDQMQHVVKKRVDHSQNVRIAEHTTVVESSATGVSTDEAPREEIADKPVDEPLPDQPRLV